jgi:hypothetical protein
MDWGRAVSTNDFLTHYRRLIKLRRDTPALQSGDPAPLAADDTAGTASFARILDADKGEFALVAINRSSSTRDVAIPAKTISHRSFDFVDALGGKPVSVLPEGQVLVTLAPKSAAILIPRAGVLSRRQLRPGTIRGTQPMHRQSILSR